MTVGQLMVELGKHTASATIKVECNDGMLEIQSIHSEVLVSLDETVIISVLNLEDKNATNK